MKLPGFLTGIVITIIVFILFLVSVLIFSFTLNENLVTSDYYSDELAYQANIDDIVRTRRLGSDISIRYVTSDGILISVPDAFKNRKISGKVQLYRPSDKRLDKWTDFTPWAGKQIISTKGLVSGLWIVKISWTMDQLNYYTEARVVIN